MGKPSSKYEIIREIASQPNGQVTITELCSIAGVSRSGYYRWLSTDPARQTRDEKDRADFELILNAFYFLGYKKGARSIYMKLLHMAPPIRMNVKKIRRIMKKFGLLCPIRKANPYRRMQTEMKTNHVAENLVNREFAEHGPRQILLTDITYMNYFGGRCYLSTILDAYTHEILAYVLSES